MFALRLVAVTFSVFVLVYCGMSLAVLCTWRRICHYGDGLPLQRLAQLLFFWRLFPLFIAILITAGFAVPSFLLLEPRAIVEPIGSAPIVLALFGTVLAALGLGNAALSWRRACSTVSSWTSAAEPVQSVASVPVLRIQRSIPPLTAAGILRSKILLSGSAEFLLNGNELRTALNHEIAHIHRRDNLKKLLLRFVPFLGMRALETAWLEASEMAADDAAICSTADALDLAAALIKLSRLKPAEAAPDLTAALVQGRAAIIHARVERLISWTGEAQPRSSSSATMILSFSIPAIGLFLITYGSLLADVHQATEWLVR
jgi:beta-lactamase regulating signal transducer with metallopeptidase domain